MNESTLLLPVLSFLSDQILIWNKMEDEVEDKAHRNKSR